ncbi:MAG: hypothetical protein RSC24_06650 [Clostridium sp.]
MNELIIKEQLFELSTCNFYSVDPATGLELSSGTIESHQLERTVESDKIRGGVDNDLLTVIDKSSDITLTVTDVVNRRDVLASKLGGLKNGLVTVKHLPRNYEVKSESSALVVTLIGTPLNANSIKVYNNKTGQPLVKTSGYTISGAKITIVESSIKAGDTIYVTGFDYSVTADYIDIPSISNIKATHVVIEKPIWNADGEIVFYKQYNFPKAKMDGSFTEKGSTEKSANPDETKYTITKDGNEISLGKIVYIPVSASISAKLENEEEAIEVLKKIKK